MSASDRDREYMRRIGAYKAESHRDAQARHLALPDPRASRAKLAASISKAASSSALDRRDDDPSPFYAKARELGLYKP